jgi:hypothetical protein
MLPADSATVRQVDLETQPVMRWGAIFGGWLVATGIASMFYVGGLALGFSAFDPNNSDIVAKGVGTGAAVWVVLTWAVSLFLGGMFASWFDGRSDQTVGALHGVTVWGLSVTASGLLLALGMSQVFQGGAAMAGAAGANARMPAARYATAAGNTTRLEAPAGTATDASAPAPATAAPADAEKTKADAARYTAATMCVALISSLLALIAAGVGGWLGAGHIHRVHHLRRYEARVARPV